MRSATSSSALVNRDTRFGFSSEPERVRQEAGLGRTSEPDRGAVVGEFGARLAPVEPLETISRRETYIRVNNTTLC